MLAEAADGAPLSLLLALRRNHRDQLDVRLAEGAQVYDGRRVWALAPTPAGWTVRDSVRGTVLPLPAPATARLLRVEERKAWFETGDTRIACDLRDARCDGALALPDLPLAHAGPGQGFRLALEDGSLRVYLPQAGDTGTVLATGVARILGAYWVRDGTGEAEAAQHRAFRGRARVHARAAPVGVDGALDDWDAAPLVVEAPWQIQDGGAVWSGARDASFSVAGAWTAAAVCLAGRVRDDAIGAGDALRVALAEVTVAVPLDGTAPPAGAAVRREWLGAAFELCVPMDRLPARGTLPLEVRYTDIDPGEPGTTLSSAPASGVPLGALVLDAPGAPTDGT